MGIKESALAAITTITQSDLIRAVTAAGASRRITVANLAKAIIENYTGSSLAGSSQSVKAALDSLNSKMPNGNYGSLEVLVNSIELLPDYTASVFNGNVTLSKALGATNDSGSGIAKKYADDKIHYWYFTPFQMVSGIITPSTLDVNVKKTY